MTPPPKSDLPQGTLDMLILQIVASGRIHGYGIAQRLQRISRDVLQVQQGSLYFEYTEREDACHSARPTSIDDAQRELERLARDRGLASRVGSPAR